MTGATEQLALLGLALMRPGTQSPTAETRPQGGSVRKATWFLAASVCVCHFRGDSKFGKNSH